MSQFAFRTTLRATALAACLLAGAAVAAPSAPAQPVVAVTPAPVKQQLARLAAAFHHARATFNPLLYATANGDSRYDDQLGLTISPQRRAAQFALYRKMQKQLAHIPRQHLSNNDALTCELLAYELDGALALAPFPEHLLPLDHFDNVPGTLANYAGGTGSQPLATVKQQQAYLSRLNQLPAWIDQAIVNMKVGVKAGIVQPKTIIEAMLPQFRQMRSDTVEANIFYSPAKNFPATFSDADKHKLEAAYRATVGKKLMPALDRLVRYLETDYLAAGRASTGWDALPNGAAWYLALVKDRTTLSLTPDQIHNKGLEEVARIQKQWIELGPKLGYTGAPNELPQWVTAQSKFKPFTTEQQVLDAYLAIDTKVKTKLPAMFSLLPKAQIELHLEPELSKATASDHYTPPAADGSHPGVFWPVVNDPKDYSRVGMVTLFLHEGQPGHHLHAALLKELDIPDFRKFDTENMNSAAYTEGWALYSETLGMEMGFYEDPEAYFGHLNAELMRAVRLVVDTGLHSKGWSREQAIAYMAKNLGWSDARARNQVERYMVWPSQALAYKSGALKILELRDRAKAALGDKFTLPAFHAVVIGDGTLPLSILEARVDKWIATTK
ncbi:MAG: DUF885 domain-containing protein [Pseudomonadota bacterium]